MLTTTATVKANPMYVRTRGQMKSRDLQSIPLLFVHGWWGGPWVWDPFIDFFTGLGFQCSAMDLSENCVTEFDVREGNVSFQQHLDRVLEKTRELGDPIVIGHSAGGLLTQKLLEQVDLPAAVLVASAAPRGIFALRSLSVFRAILRHGPAILLKRPLLPGKEEMCELNLNRLSPAEQSLVYDKMAPASAKQVIQIAITGIPVNAHCVTTPVMVINGTDDKLTPVSVAEAIAKKYGGALRTYSDSGHYIMQEQGWEKVASDIQQWLSELFPGIRDAERNKQVDA
ncbi:MAG: alpha/beta hydrolase [Pirellulaceae bacterium]